jgi:TolA-binding protein
MMVLKCEVQGFRGWSKALASVMLAGSISLGTVAWGQPQPLSLDESATLLLNSAKVAFNEQNYAVAIERFRTCLQKGQTRAFLAQARYGLGLSLLESPEKDYSTALEVLAPLAAPSYKDYVDHPYALYYVGLAYRGLGLKVVGLATTRPADAPQLGASGNQKFLYAANYFGNAAEAFLARAKAAGVGDGKELPVAWEWAARARCDQAEMLLRLGRAKEAAAAVEPVMNDPMLGRSRYHKQAAYEQGYALFMLQDYIAAAKSLVLLAPFDDSEMGMHARYLLARTHHMAGERPEAETLYDAVEAAWAKQKSAAPAPDYVYRAGFYTGILLYEQGKFADALARFTAFMQQDPRSALLPEAQLRQGFCQVQLKQFPQAMATLGPLAENPKLADQALRWLARAQIGAADPTNLAAYDQALKGAIEKLKLSAQRLLAITSRTRTLVADPDSKGRRSEVLLELGDVQALAKLYADAAVTYQQVIAENNNAEAVELAHYGLVAALQLSGQYKACDEACLRFQQLYPRSTFLPAVVFRYAENPYLMAASAAVNPKNEVPAAEMKQRYTMAISRYQQMIQKYPGYQHLSLAKQGLASAYYQLGDFDNAGKALASIPEGDRIGTLNGVNYMLADCLLRTLPPAGDDAISMARLLSQLDEAANLLTGVMMAEGHPLVPEATIKLGYTLQRQAALITDPQEKAKTLTKARSGYARFMLPLKTHPLYPLALLEDAKVVSQLGAYASAIQQLKPFESEPLRSSPLATLAQMRMAEALRALRRPAEAATLLGQWRQQYEPALLKDPARAQWVPALQYGHAMALKEAGQFQEAMPLFQSIAKQFPDRPEALEVPLRIAQCRREETVAKMDAAAKLLALASTPAEKQQEAKATISLGVKELHDIADLFVAQAQKLEKVPDKLDDRLRALYEAAWCYRGIGDVEVDLATAKLREMTLQRLQDRWAAENPGRPVPALRAPEIKLAQVPVQPSEQKARDLYKAVIVAGVDAPLAMDARLELAELYTTRGEYELAIPVFVAALQQDMAPDMADRMRVRLGACYLAKGDGKAAYPQFAAILSVPRSVLMASARYGAGEAMMLQKNWQQAIQLLLPFQDGDLYRHLPGLSDRALLQLGYAYAQLNQWDASRRALDALVTRFPRSPFAIEGQFALGVALQSLKQYDNAITAYNVVVLRSGEEVAARAQIQIGLCRLEQNRPQDAANALLTTVYTYDYPNCTAMALCEAGRAYLAAKQPAEAAKVLQRVLKDFPKSQWADLATKRLAEIK